MTKIKVIIVDDSDFVRDGMGIILGVDDEFQVVGCAKNGREALEFAQKEKPDVFLMDIQMPEMDGIAATKEIVAKGLGKVLILTTFDDRELVEKAMKNGADGYLIKNHTPEQLKQSIKSVYHGVHFLDSQVLDKFTEPETKCSTGFDGSLFTVRELGIIEAVANGLSNKEIAEKLFLSEGTVKNYISVILDKGNLSHRTQMAIYYLTGRR
ncbi:MULTISPECIES: response regulator [unclassified Acetobacterium]|jgi:DNA-binding NarL/FixJ family response regulator|uniref:response regulator n=1 Tax=unclassified Acetobacterium TaxID=2638182 RepID=UPI000DBEB02A|nr:MULTISPECIES: response regulator transcription factor [unclassified Acetobacterium]AWW27529.1 DNA-binding response regulator [Acetobacterium sp. KB-1]MDZ5724049.1 response regulator transcription factor [Acetobacterium sp. K1/6]